MKNKTVNALIELGMSADIKGFQYIVDVMCLFEKTEWRNGKITSLYKKVAQMNGTTASRVERAIRVAFKAVLTKGKLEQVEKYLTFQKPTNGNLLHVLYYRLAEDE